MKSGKRVVLIVGLLGVLFLPPPVSAGEEYVLEFIPTQNAPPGAQGTMTIKVVNGETIVHFRVRGAFPDTIYTLWTVFNVLVGPPFPTTGQEVPACPAAGPGDPTQCPGWTGRHGFPQEGNGVSPLARLDAAFTSGMGLDPGASFVTSDKGHGEVRVKLDYDLVRDAPVSNKDVIVQCVPVPGPSGKTDCVYSFVGFSPTPGLTRRVTTTWLRRFIGEFVLAERATMCANYEARFDPDVVPDATQRLGMDARYWQCIDPATVDPRTGNGLPRVHRFPFDHFRLANHPDDLTHGFIGGNATDHRIDLVGRRADLMAK